MKFLYKEDKTELMEKASKELEKLKSEDIPHRLKFQINGEFILGEPLEYYGSIDQDTYQVFFSGSKQQALNKVRYYRTDSFFEMNDTFYNVANISSIEVVPV